MTSRLALNFCRCNFDAKLKLSYDLCLFFLDLLKKSAPSRIIFTSSFMSFFNNLSLENLNYDSKSEIFSAARIYCNSKLTQMIASDIFASKLKGTGVTSNSVNPGIVHTTLLSQFYSIQTKLKPLKLVTDLYQLTMAKVSRKKYYCTIEIGF